jgi:hypothetical protein
MLKIESKSRRKPLTTLNIAQNFTTRSARAMEIEKNIFDMILQPTGPDTSPSWETISNPTSSSTAKPEADIEDAASDTDDEIPRLTEPHLIIV